jgi:DNA-binding transcriptional LysR family regulator
MRLIDIARTDLNLLVVLDVLLQERNVTRAARRLHRTQSATSHALGRLREQLCDPLLVRVGGEMRPTPKAERLAGEVSRILATIGRVLSDEGVFDPATTSRVFTFAGPDYVAGALPGLLARMATSTPSAGVEFVPASAGMLRDVAEGRLDAAVGPSSIRGIDGLRVKPLVSLDWAVFARRGHPAVRGWSARRWAAYPHVRIRVASGGEGPVDVAVRAHNLTRRIGATLPHFLLAPPLLARTDYLLTVPHATLAGVAAQFDLVTLPCPLSLPRIEHALYWSANLDRDAANVWFRHGLTETVIEALGTNAPPRTRRRASRTA